MWMKCSGVQSAFAPQMPSTKLRSSSIPCRVCTTSGWNCTAQMRRASSAIPASAFAVFAVCVKPAGRAFASSPWLIHTSSVAGRPRKSCVSAITSTCAWPYSRAGAGSIRPPR